MPRSASPPRSRTISPQQQKLSEKLREFRETNNLTLDAVHQMTGVSIATLSKLENDLVQVKFETLTRIFTALDVGLSPLEFEPAAGHGQNIVNRAQSPVVVDSATYEYRVLSAGLPHKSMLPIEIVVKARSIEDFDEWNQHAGEELIYVLSGEVRFYMEMREPILLKAGESVQYDSAIKHAMASVGPEDARVLSVTTGVPPQGAQTKAD